jgi:twitching motility two-component system response regulator PilG
MNDNTITKTILIVDDDMDFLRCVENFINVYAEHIDVLTASDGREAMQILREKRVDLVVTDITMPVMDGIELLDHLKLKHQNIPAIVMTDFSTPENHKRLAEIGQFYIFEKTMKLKTLGEKILNMLNRNFRAYVRGVTLENLLQMIQIEQKSCTLKVSSKDKIGYLYLKDGKLVNAETSGIEGEEAAVRIIAWVSAETEMQGNCQTETKIQTSLMHILLKAAQFKDENAASLSHADLLAEAIKLAEGHHYKRAKMVLARLLKQNPRNAKGWLWFSRIAESMKAVEMALKNAAKISPGDQEVSGEFENLELTKSRSGNGDFRRCPFCWFLLERGTVLCIKCSSHLVINNQLLRSISAANQQILSKAIDRYMNVIHREKNAKAYYYLGMAYLNSQNWEEALTHLDKAVKLDPMRQFYSKQLQTLLNHMASTKGITGQNYFPQEKPSDDAAATAQNLIKRNKILVVEDSSTTRKVIAITLSQNGYEIIEATDGLEALSKLNETRPDLILLDIILPKMDGYKILSIIKENPEFRKIPVIMLTSKDGIINKVKGKVAGSTAYLTKPFDPSQLVATIEKHLNKDERRIAHA